MTLYWYEPSSSSKQAVVVTEITPSNPGKSTSVTITGEFYDLQINKRDSYTGSALDGATFQLLFNGSPMGLLQQSAGNYTYGGSTSTFTTSGGRATITMLPAGNYSLVEVSAPTTGYVVSAAKSIQLYNNSSVTVDNAPTRMEVTKKNILTGAVMPGLSFELLDGSNNPVPVTKHADGTYRPAATGSNTFTLDGNGKAVFLYFPNGTYKFKEVSIPGYAELTGNTLTLSGTATITLQNDPLTLILTKVDSFTGANMPNIPFTLLDSAGNPVMLTKVSDGVYHYDTGSTTSVFATGANGTATIHYIPTGTYTLRESSTAGSGYAAHADASVNVSIKNGSKNAATVRFQNDPITLEFTKLDAVTRLALDGGTFRLNDNSGNAINLKQITPDSYRPDGAGNGTFTTSGGKAAIRYLTPGQYTIEEITPPGGYKPDEIKTVTITEQNDASSPAKVSMEDEPLSIEFTKTDHMTGKRTDGAVFSLKDADGGIVKLTKVRDGVYMPDNKGADTFTTANGSVMIAPIKPGTYIITEVQAATGYASAPDVSVTITDDNVSSNPAKAAMSDAPLSLHIEKRDGETKAPIGGAVFQLLNGDTPVKLAPISGKAGWYRPDNNGTDTFAVPEGGMTIAYIPEGTYRLVEVEAPAGYVITTSGMDLSIIKADTYLNPKQAIVENAPLIVTLLKLDKNRNAPIPGVSFRVLDENGEAVLFTDNGSGVYSASAKGEMLIKTNTQGKATLRLLPIGAYTLVEAGNPGYKAADPVAFTVTEANTWDDPVSITVENEPLYFRLEKADKCSGWSLAKVPFKMTDSDGKPLYFLKQSDGIYDITTVDKGDGPAGPSAEASPAEVSNTFYTDSKGTALIGYIPVGVYTLHEQEYDGYGVLPPERIIVADENTLDNPATIKLKNIPLAAEIFKTDSYTKEPLQGVQFKLLKDGAHVRVARMSDGAFRPASTISNTTGGKNEESKSGEEAAALEAEADKKSAATVVETVDYLTTDEKGKIRIEYLNTCAYTLEEIPLAGYAVSPGGGSTLGPAGPSPYNGLGFTMQSSHTMDAPLRYDIANIPTRLIVEKQHAVTRALLPGAKISLAYKESSQKIALVKQKDGTYRPARDGEKGETIISLDEKAQAIICYLNAGEITITEEEAPEGYALAAPLVTEVGTPALLQIALNAQGKESSRRAFAAETSVAILDNPLALRISKVHAKTGKPLKGAAFQLKAAGMSSPLRFTLKDSKYMYDTKGNVTTIELDGNAEALILNIPAGKYNLEETVVPEGYFPAVPIALEVKQEHTSEAPLEIVVPNAPVVKLGFDTDKYLLPTLCGGLLLMGGALLFMGLRRKKAE